MTLPTFGSDSQYSMAIESSYATPAAFTSSHAVGLDDLQIDPDLEFIKIREHLGSPSLSGEVEGKISGKWSASFDHKPRTAGTPPQYGAILQAALGSVTGSTYTFSNTISSMRLLKMAGVSYQEVALGAGVSTLEIEVVGGQLPKIKAEGPFSRYGMLIGSPTTTGTANTGQATVVLGASSRNMIRPGAVVTFGANTNSGAGYYVLAVADDGVTLTLGSNVAGANITTGTAVEAYYPSGYSYAGTVLGGIECGLSIGGTSVGFIEYKAKISTGVEELNAEANTRYATRLGKGERIVEGSFKFYLLDETAGIFGRYPFTGETVEVECRVGPDTTAERVIYNAPAARLSVRKITVPQYQVATFEATWLARQDAASNDEFSIDHT